MNNKERIREGSRFVLCILKKAITTFNDEFQTLFSHRTNFVN